MADAKTVTEYMYRAGQQLLNALRTEALLGRQRAQHPADETFFACWMESRSSVELAQQEYEKALLQASDSSK